MISEQTTWKVVFHQEEKGSCPVREFTSTLPARERAKVFHLLAMLADYGLSLGMPHSRQVEGKLYELRAGPIRLFYFAHVDRQFVIVHGYRKRSQKAPHKELNTALRRMGEVLKEKKDDTS